MPFSTAWPKILTIKHLPCLLQYYSNSPGLLKLVDQRSYLQNVIWTEFPSLLTHMQQSDGEIYLATSWGALRRIITIIEIFFPSISPFLVLFYRLMSYAVLLIIFFSLPFLQPSFRIFGKKLPCVHSNIRLGF